MCELTRLCLAQAAALGGAHLEPLLWLRLCQASLGSVISARGSLETAPADGKEAEAQVRLAAQPLAQRCLHGTQLHTRGSTQLVQGLYLGTALKLVRAQAGELAFAACCLLNARQLREGPSLEQSAADRPGSPWCLPAVLLWICAGL